MDDALTSAIDGAKTFCVVNLGCKVNRVESDTIAARLANLGCVSATEDAADIIVVNTCTVTGEADKKTRKAVRHALRASGSAPVVVTGCAAAVDGDTYRAMDGRVIVIDRTRLIADLAQASPQPALRTGGDFRTRINMKVQDGCNHACTYCIVHTARGRARSVPFADVVAEARQYLARGAKELVLTGIDLGSYRDGDKRIAQLTHALMEAADELAAPGEAPARIRASSMEPMTIDGAFVDLLAQSEGRLCRHLHLPLQSGSTKVLREMARPYSAEAFCELVAGLYDKVPALALTTDIIVGFPGETDDEFSETLDVARRSRFSKIHVFPYSKRAGTPAAARADQVSPQVALARAAKLRALSDELRRADYARRAGTVEQVLVETRHALTESYHEIPIPLGAKEGQLMPVELPKL